MKRRPAGGPRVIPLAAALVLGGLTLWLWPVPERATPERIVLIVVDTLRRDHLSSYGGDTPTPRLDALATRGRRFENVLASYHQTTMSMGALFTGHTPSLDRGAAEGVIPWNGRTWCGLARFATPGREPGCLPRAVPTLPERMRRAGYWTIGIVTNPLLFAPAGFERGFDIWRELRDPKAKARPGLGRRPIRRSASAARVREAVREALAARRNDRFFLYLHYMDVHDYLLWHQPYATMVQRVDAAIGALLDDLAEEGLLEGTAIVVTADHGERLRERHLVHGRPGHRGNPSFEEVLRIPLIVVPDPGPPGGPLLRSTEIHGLLLHLAGAEEPPSPELACEELYLSEMGWQTYRDDRFKSYRNRRTGEVHLVDLEADPNETLDVTARFPEVVDRHTARVESLARSLGALHRGPEGLSEEDRRRLEALGYLE
ncbi:MAG: sulfatase [Myxococcota bacterium]